MAKSKKEKVLAAAVPRDAAKKSAAVQSHQSESRKALTAAAALILAAASSSISQLSLSLVYGSIPASRYHQVGITATALLALVGQPHIQRYLPWRPLHLLPVIAAFIPVIQCLVFPYSGQLGVSYGPLITELVTYYPLLLLAMADAASIFSIFEITEVVPAIREMIPFVLSFVLFNAGRTGFEKLVQPLIGTSPTLSRGRLQLGVALGFSALAPSTLLLLVLPALFHTVWLNPHLISAHGDLVLNTALEAHNYTMLARKESVTGYVSVLDSHENEFRVLRCDHSLLGGDWLVTEKSRKQGQKVRETVYSIFTMMESARLVEREVELLDKESSALFIGLGIGTSTKAFIEHGINTTVIELDPVVHEFAVKYFDLPTNHIAYLQDALPFVRDRILTQPASYDYIIHDVFTGGAEPTALFTFEFLMGLDILLKDDGVIAINYAADLTLPPSKIVLRTIYHVFPTCRIFRDTDPKESAVTFVNMVVFCTKHQNGKIDFRKPVQADFLNSMTRRQWIPPHAALEIKYDDLLSMADRGNEALILRKGAEEKLEKYHQESAANHWKIMRNVLPDAVWELW